MPATMPAKPPESRQSHQKTKHMVNVLGQPENGLETDLANV